MVNVVALQILPCITINTFEALFKIINKNIKIIIGIKGEIEYQK